MSNTDIDQAVAAHYGRGELTARILKALGPGSAGPLTLAALAQVDQLHHGGLGLTERLVKVAEIERGMHVLDAGSGIGGAARHLAFVCGCTVEAIDLTPDFVNTGAELDALVGLSERISHRVGSVTELPYENSGFDVVWSQNVTMNIADKSAMFAEALRVLRPGGVFAFTHLAKGNGEALDYPMPWAASAQTSFLGSPDEIFENLKDAGFENASNHAPGGPPPPPPPLPPGDAPDDTVVMGEDMPVRVANAKNAVIDGRLVPMMVTARRPA
jgi:SAM-dependent methyltransferase